MRAFDLWRFLRPIRPPAQRVVDRNGIAPFFRHESRALADLAVVLRTNLKTEHASVNPRLK
jgi:hypothetical protein